MSRYCTLTLQSTTFSFNTTVLPPPPQNKCRLALHAVCFLPYQSLTKLYNFPSPISDLIQNSIPNFKRGLALHFQHMTPGRAATQENAFVLCNTQSVPLRGSSNAYGLYKVYITLHFTVPDKTVQLHSL